MTLNTGWGWSVMIRFIKGNILESKAEALHQLESITQKKILKWSKRKAEIFNQEIITTAYQQLMKFKDRLGYEHKLPQKKTPLIID